MESVTPAGTPRRGRRRARRPGWSPVASVRRPAACPARGRRRRRAGRPTTLCLAAARPAAAGRGPPGARRVRGPRGRRAGAAAAHRRGRGGPARSPRPTGCAPRCSPRSATTCAPRWPRPRPRSPACAPTDVQWTAERPGRAAGHRRRVARPADPAGGQPARHEPAAGRRAGGVPAPGRRWTTIVARGAGRPRARPADGVAVRHPRRPARGAGRPGPAGAGHRQPGRPTRCGTPRPARRRC